VSKPGLGAPERTPASVGTTKWYGARGAMESSTIIITGTDTGVGKTVVAAAIVGATGGVYWKPIQAGPERDTEVVQRLTGLPDAHFLPEAYALPAPLCPSVAARRAGACIALPLLPPRRETPLIIEGAGGVFVPINGAQTMADLFAALAAPVVLVARTALGTINHTLLSLEALAARRIPVLGVVFAGEDNPETIAEIERFGRVPTLGCLPHLDPLTPGALRSSGARTLAPVLEMLRTG
jgi:dethiobiotin synthetase